MLRSFCHIPKLLCPVLNCTFPPFNVMHQLFQQYNALILIFSVLQVIHFTSFTSVATAAVSCAATPVLLSSPTVNETILAMSSPFRIHLTSQFRFTLSMLQNVHRLVRLVWAVSFYCRSSTFRPHQRSLFVF